MKAYLSKRAARAAERIDARWRTHGDEPDLFAMELLAAIEHLAHADPWIGPQNA